MKTRSHFQDSFTIKNIGFISGAVIIMFLGISLTAQKSNDISEPENSYKLSLVRDAPVYPGCENLDEFYIRKCLSQNIEDHFSLNFNSDVLIDFDIPLAMVRFTINYDGRITLNKVSPSNDELYVEASQVVDEFPKVEPGKRNEKAVNVKYYIVMELIDDSLKIMSGSGPY